MEAVMVVVMDILKSVKQVIHISKVLSVGMYTIRIIGCCETEEGYELPDSATGFLEKLPNDKNKWDLVYILNPQEQVVLQASSAIPVAGYEDGPMPYRIFQESSGNYLWLRMNKDKSSCLEYRISGNWNVWELLYDSTLSSSSNYFEELAYIFPYSILNKGGIMFHGVVMEWKSMGIIICAHSGVGKTTHTRMWRDQEGALILNGDRALCCREETTWYTYGSPWNGSSGECINRKAGLKAIVLLEQAENNQILHLSRLQGAKELIPLAFAPAWEPELLNHALDSIDEITCGIPVFKLRCRPEEEAVSILKQELEKLRYEKLQSEGGLRQ